ncbi:hypothetical protein GCM10020218_013780 [Dactylosporangium vinaceum]
MFKIRESRRPQGCMPLLAERAAYFEFVGQGVRTGVVCRLVGVAERTGWRWRREAAGAAAVVAAVVAARPPVVVSGR